MRLKVFYGIEPWSKWPTSTSPLTAIRSCTSYIAFERNILRRYITSHYIPLHQSNPLRHETIEASQGTAIWPLNHIPMWPGHVLIPVLNCIFNMAIVFIENFYSIFVQLQQRWALSHHISTDTTHNNRFQAQSSLKLEICVVVSDLQLALIYQSKRCI